MPTTEIHKAAVLLMSLPQAQAAAILAQLDPRQVAAVTAEIAKNRAISPEEQQSVILEFADVNPDALENFHQGAPFRFLRNVDSQTLLTFLIDEHPQTVALVLSHLPQSYAAEIIVGLRAEQQLEIVRRIAAMRPTSPEIIREVADALERRMSHAIAQRFETSGGVPRVAEILGAADRATEHRVLEDLSREDPCLAHEIRGLLFEFEDIRFFSDQDVQTILKIVDALQWAAPLKGASQELQQKILSNLPKRARSRLQAAMDQLGPQRLAAVERARRPIVDAIQRLEDAGEISVGSLGGTEKYVL